MISVVQSVGRQCFDINGYLVCFQHILVAATFISFGFENQLSIFKMFEI